MPNFQVIMKSEYKCMPWKNGLGKTFEIQRSDDQNGLRFRISQARVIDNGLFSDFSGLHRTLVLLSGNGMTLEHKSQSHNHSYTLNNPLDIARFSGGDKTYATLKNEAIEDLNIMVREVDTQAKVSAVTSGQLLMLSDSDDHVFSAFYANNACTIYPNVNTVETQSIHLPAGSLLCLRDDEVLLERGFLVTDGNGVLIEISGK
ncbi:HutD family protein [Vibrio sp. DW001]|uniref:HutD/Ves family protein n=1 Tax=Vibrio sp. DW001 TaxID=2912315 RepID=UPI0023B0F87C|nr:HutD family protein [Vibrio sp. DW001]WED27578.1 HutD family protein [Vibrio sp. DW001]